MASAARAARIARADSEVFDPAALAEGTPYCTKCGRAYDNSETGIAACAAHTRNTSEVGHQMRIVPPAEPAG